MTTPDRSITGLPQRPKTDASRLIAANRTTSPQAASQDPDAPAPSPGRVKVSVYLDPNLRDAARAAYRATAHLEQDASWSDMVQKAIATEIERRQRTHNDGDPFPHGAAKLTPGRQVIG